MAGLPIDPIGVVASGQHLRVPVLAGNGRDAVPQITLEQWIAGQYLPVATPVTGFDARTELLDELFLGVAARNALNTLRSTADAAQMGYTSRL